MPPMDQAVEKRRQEICTAVKMLRIVPPGEYAVCPMLPRIRTAGKSTGKNPRSHALYSTSGPRLEPIIFVAK